MVHGLLNGKAVCASEHSGVDGRNLDSAAGGLVQGQGGKKGVLGLGSRRLTSGRAEVDKCNPVFAVHPATAEAMALSRHSMTACRPGARSDCWQQQQH